MPRNAATGIYTRVSNSFSEPVIGTTIDPNDADTFFDDVESAMNSFIGTSTTSLAIGTGSKTFTTQTGKSFIAGTFVQAISAANSANYMYGSVTSYNTNTGELIVDVVTVGGSGTLADWGIFFSGGRGGTGATGSTGADAGIKYTFNSATSGDPATGKFLFNNTTFMSATSMNISETDGDSNGISAFLATLDDSTSTNKTLCYIKKENGTAGFLFYITGTLTDNGTYDTFSITPIAALGSISNNDACKLNAYRTGDKGTDGLGTGDFSSNTATSVDGEIVLFSGTGGKTGKRATTTGLAKLTSGVLSAAVAGTDYCAATSGSGVLKGSSGNTAAATAGTDFVKPDTTTAFTAHQGFTLATLTDGANISWTVSTGQKAKVTLGGNRTMNAVTGAVEGTTYFLWVIQDATGSRTVTWTTSGAGSFDFGTSGAPTLTTTASKADLLCFEALSIGGTLKLRYAGIKQGFA